MVLIAGVSCVYHMYSIVSKFPNKFAKIAAQVRVQISASGERGVSPWESLVSRPGPRDHVPLPALPLLLYCHYIIHFVGSHILF